MNRIKSMIMAVTLVLGGVAFGAAGSQTLVSQAMAQSYQGSSNRNIWQIRHRVEVMIGQLNRDARDYGGHRAAAIRDLQTARGEMLAAESFARSHGY